MKASFKKKQKAQEAPPPAPAPVVVAKVQRGIGVRVDYADKDQWCPNNDFCGAEHKGPALHEVRTGWCGIGSPPEAHQKCVGIYSTAGRRKVVHCTCICHLPPLKKLKKLPHHA